MPEDDISGNIGSQDFWVIMGGPRPHSNWGSLCCVDKLFHSFNNVPLFLQCRVDPWSHSSNYFQVPHMLKATRQPAGLYIAKIFPSNIRTSMSWMC